MFWNRQPSKASIISVMNATARGIFKRIDENRELLELLQREAPEFLARHFWVGGWLKDHDLFFTALAGFVPAGDLPLPVRAGKYPRPWPVEPAETSSESRWKAHAYPLRQVTVQAQGTKHCDREAVIRQLELAIARLRSGDMSGVSHDDDFGFRFSEDRASNGPSFFVESCGETRSNSENTDG